MPRRIAIVGPGRVGSYWARAGIRSGFEVDIRARSPENCPEDLRDRISAIPDTQTDGLWGEFDLVLLTVSDSSIAEICAQIHIAAALNESDRGPIIAHVSGQLSPKVLTDAGVPRRRSVAAHPLFPFKSRDTSPDSGQVFHALEGQLDAVQSMGRIIAESGSHHFHLDHVNRPLYHLACVVASNHLITLYHVAQRLLEKATGPGVVPAQALQNLVEASATNLKGESASSALTGPANRGDSAAISGHFSALSELEPEYEKLYEHLLRATLPLIGEADQKQIRELLDKLPR